MSEVLLYNSNGTIVTDVYSVCRSYIERNDPGLLAHKKITPPVRDRRMSIADRAQKDGAYRAVPINGIEDCLNELEQQGIQAGIVSNAGSGFIVQSLNRAGLDSRVDSVYALYDPHTKHHRKKDVALLNSVARDEASRGNMVIGYVSHKKDEAEEGAKAYGLGVLITSSVSGYSIIRAGNGYIIKVSSLKYLPAALMEYKAKYRAKGKSKSQTLAKPKVVRTKR